MQQKKGTLNRLLRHFTVTTMLAIENDPYALVLEAFYHPT